MKLTFTPLSRTGATTSVVGAALMIVGSVLLQIGLSAGSDTAAIAGTGAFVAGCAIFAFGGLEIALTGRRSRTPRPTNTRPLLLALTTGVALIIAGGLLAWWGIYSETPLWGAALIFATIGLVLVTFCDHLDEAPR